MEILFYIFAVLLIVALLALLVVPIWYGIKQARNKSNDKCVSSNIVKMIQRIHSRNLVLFAPLR